MSKLLQALQGVEAPKVSLRELQGANYKAAAVQVTRKEQTDYAGGFNQIAANITQAYGMYDERRRREGDEKRNEILLKNLKPEELGQLRRDGTLLYQDDPYAMKSLEKELGRMEAFNVDATIQQRVANGDYKTRDEMEADRSALMEMSRKNMAQAYGMPEEGTEYFTKGYAENMVDRNMALYGSFSKKMDETLRSESRVATRNNISAVALSDQTSGADVLTVVNRAREDGLIRNDSEYLDHMTKAMSDVVTRPNGYNKVMEMMDAKIKLMDGTETTMRVHLGEEGARGIELAAAENVNKFEVENVREFRNQITNAVTIDLSQADGFATGMNQLVALEEQRKLDEGDANNTSRAQEIMRAMEQLKARQAAFNDKKAKGLKDGIQQNNRVLAIQERVQRKQAGEALPLTLESYTETELTGKFSAQDYQHYYDLEVTNIQNNPNLAPADKQKQMMELGALLKSQDSAGFGARYKAQVDAVNNEFTNVARQLDAGLDMPETPRLNSFVEMYKASPADFIETYGDDSEIALTVQAIADTGISPEIIIKGKASLGKLSKEQRVLSDQQFTTMFEKRGTFPRLPQADQQALRTWYASMTGLDDAQKGSAIDKYLEERYVDIKQKSGRGVIGTMPKEFFRLNPEDKQSADQGNAIFNEMLDEKFKGVDVVGMSVMSDGNRVMIQTGYGTTAYIYKEDMLERYNKAKAGKK